jgi:hypothetical protein
MLLSAEVLLSNTSFRAHMSYIYDRLFGACSSILQKLHAAIPSLPGVLRILAADLQAQLVARDFPSLAIGAVLSDMILVRLVIPAIIYPEAYGIVLDAPIGAVSRRNLTLIAHVLRDVGRGVVAQGIAPPDENLAPAYSRLAHLNAALGKDNIDVAQWLVRLLQPPPTSISGKGRANPGPMLLQFPPYALNRRGQQCLFLLTQGQLQALVTVAASALPRLPPGHRWHATIGSLHNTYKNTPDYANLLQGDVLVLPAQVASGYLGGLLTEHEVLSAAAGEKAIPAARASDLSVLEAFRPVLEDAARKLAGALSQMAYSSNWGNLTLLELLRAEVSEAALLKQTTLETHIHEAISSVTKYAGSAHASGVASVSETVDLLISQITTDIETRAVYLRYLTTTRLDLLSTLEYLRRLELRARHSAMATHRFFLMSQVRQFHELHSKKLVSFMEEFRQLEMLDEKNTHLRQFMDSM